MTRMLKTADPTIVPIPMSDLATKTPIIEVNNSGAEEPAAIKVAPATSSERFNFYSKVFKLIQWSISLSEIEETISQSESDQKRFNLKTSLRNSFKGWNEEIVTNNCDGDKEPDCAKNTQKYH